MNGWSVKQAKLAAQRYSKRRGNPVQKAIQKEASINRVAKDLVKDLKKLEHIGGVYFNETFGSVYVVINLKDNPISFISITQEKGFLNFINNGSNLTVNIHTNNKPEEKKQMKMKSYTRIKNLFSKTALERMRLKLIAEQI